jgi:NAD(P)-dependent dehydrogenase (short-subunit alcohol dehydrogenase family)
MTLAGRGAIITGANQGLGREIATHFVRAGASVVLAARGQELLRQTEAELRTLASAGQVVVGVAADVSRPEDCRGLVERAGTVLPELTVLVNNAAISGPLGLVEENDWAAWAGTIAINLFGPVLMCRAALPALKARRYGKIINLSGGGATAPRPRMSAYACSKAALVRFTETLAEEVRDWHIDVNAIAPGSLNTRLLDDLLAAGPEGVGREYEKAVKQRDTGGTPLSKGAELAVFLAGAVSDGITGRLLSAVWDNWASLPDRKQELAKSDIYTLRRIIPEDRGQKWSA